MERMPGINSDFSENSQFFKKKLKIFSFKYSMEIKNWKLKILPLFIILYSLFFIPLAHADITTGLVGHWKLDEGTGTTAGDSSGNNNTGTLTNGPTWTVGKVGNGGLNFDGTNDYITIPDSTSLRDLPNTALTVTSWIKVNNTGLNAYVFSKQENSSTVGWVFKLDNSRRARLIIQRATTDFDVLSAVNTMPVYSNGWFHIAITYPGGDEADNVRLYIDGTEVSSYALRTNGVGAYTSDIGKAARLGRSEFTAYSTIDQDDVRVYNRALSASDITELYNYTGSGGADTTPPVLSAGSPSGSLPSGTTQTTLSVTTDESATCKYGTVAGTAYSSIANTFTTTGGTSHSSTITGLTNGTSYNYYVRCQDTASTPNANTSDYTISFSVSSPLDTTPPTITNIQSSSITQTGATITWTTDEPSDSQVEYGLTTSYGSQTILNTSLVTSHSETLTNLTAGTLYHYRVKSKDASNNLATSGDNTFTTISATPSLTLSDCAQTTVQSAINSAIDGAVITCPAGSWDWGTTPVTINGKNLTLSGALNNGTVITLNWAGNAPLNVVTTVGTFTRVTQFKFIPGTDTGSGLGNSIYVSGPGTTFRIDHITIDPIKRRGIVVEQAKGVVDHNTLISATSGSPQGISIFGNRATGGGSTRTGSIEWQNPPQFGSANFVFIEDNIFIWSNTNNGDSFYDAYGGARFVIRYNTIQQINGGHHGNDSGEYRSPHSYEIYNNTFSRTGSSFWIVFNNRGGTGVYFNNVATGLFNASLVLQNYRSSAPYGSAGMCDGANPIDGNLDATGWPCQDQIGRTSDVNGDGLQDSMPLFQWNNTLNGNPWIPSVDANATQHIQLNRDYFNRVPQFGDSIYPYTPYAYPHPLAGGTPPPPDTTPPTISLTAPLSGATVSATTTVSADASDNVGVVGVQFKLDGNNLGAEDTSSPYTINWDTTTASNGSHTLTGVARDGANNQTTSSGVTVTVNNGADTTPPVLSAGSPSGSLPSGTTQTALSVTTNESSTCKYGTVAGVAYASIANTFTTTGATSHSSTITGLTNGSSYSYYVRCIDSSQNANTTDYVIQFSVATAAPVISNIQSTNISTTTATITWTTNENTTSKVNYGLTSSYTTSTVETPTTQASHSVTLGNLTPSTLYHFQVSSRNPSTGLTSVSADQTFTTDTPAPIPVISNIQSTNITQTGATITWSTNIASNSQVEYGLTTSYGQTTTLDSTSVILHSQTLSNLSSGTTYNYRVKSNGAVSTNNTFTTTAAPDVTPPSAISNLNTTKILNTSIDFTWTSPGDDGNTGTASSYLMRWSFTPITTANWSSAADFTGLPNPQIAGSTQNYTAIGLEANTTYYIAIRTLDEVNNLSPLSNVLTVKTKRHPPGGPKNFTANATSNSVSLNWIIPDFAQTDVLYTILRNQTGGLSVYNVTPNDTIVSASSSLTSFTDTNRPSNTNYYYSIFAYYDTGIYGPGVSVNIKTQSQSGTQSATVTTFGGGGGGGGYIDSTPPDVPKLKRLVEADSQILIEWENPTDPDFARIYITRNSIKSLSPSIGAKVLEQLATSTIVVSLTNAEKYYFSIFAIDRSNNYSLPLLVEATPKAGVTSFEEQATVMGNVAEITTYTPETPNLQIPNDKIQMSNQAKFSMPLFFGIKNDEVKTLQQFLSQDKEIYPEGLVTGFFGRLTEKAVQRFQIKHNIVTSGTPETTGFGRVGPRTLKKLEEVYGSTSSPQVEEGDLREPISETQPIVPVVPELTPEERQVKIQEITNQLLQLQKQMLELQIQLLKEKEGN